MAENRYLCKKVITGGNYMLDDAAWQQLPVMQMVKTETGEAPRQETLVRAYYDPEARVVVFYFDAEDDEILSDFTQRDEPLFRQDVMEMFFSDSGDIHRYKELELSPKNVQFDTDITYTNEGKVMGNAKWDLQGWESATTYDAEAKRQTQLWVIPYDGVDFPPVPGGFWRFNAYRIDYQNGVRELQAAFATGAPNFHVPSRFAYLDFEA